MTRALNLSRRAGVRVGAARTSAAIRAAIRVRSVSSTAIPWAGFRGR